MSILSSQADPPTLKNVDFASAGARFSKNQGLGSQDALDGVLGLSWARFGCPWGLLGSSFDVLAGFQLHFEFPKLPQEKEQGLWEELLSMIIHGSQCNE